MREDASQNHIAPHRETESQPRHTRDISNRAVPTHVQRDARRAFSGMRPNAHTYDLVTRCRVNPIPTSRPSAAQIISGTSTSTWKSFTAE